MADAMEDIDMNETEALRGVESQTLELIAEVLTREEWAELLRRPLQRAVARGNRGLAHKLVEAGAGFGDALHEAVKGGHTGIANDLLENEASVETKDERGRTPLHVAASNGQPEMVRLLLLKGADKGALERRRLTPLSLAIENKDMAAALVLLAAGDDVNAAHTMFNRTALHMAAQSGHVEMLRVVMEHGADVNAVGELGFTALHVAALENAMEVIDELVEAGADIEARDDYDVTPLFRAVEELQPVAVTALLKHGADVNARDSTGDTPLHYAAADSNAVTVQQAAEVVDILLGSGADVDAQDAEGRTALYKVARYAGTSGDAEWVDLLLRSGANEKIADKHGFDVMDAMDVAGIDAEDDELAEHVEHVRKLLANAPADRAWRRRGYLVLCRAHPNRLQLGQEITTKHDACGQETAHSIHHARGQGAKAGGCKETAVGGNLVGERTRSDLPAVVARLLRLQEDGIFRMIVGYL